ncbi:unnamed protein product [Cuscuta europaea]|uniref:Uncharacterized protein n=1 Tax=Cuscuta europaea TaxID=41803 RepID=A0A9P0ZGN8_CUSEU|nr:unnamed protein product [Cuscuta europaea]
MNRSFRAEESRTKQKMGSLRSSIMKEKDEELGLFLEMRRREKERNDLLLQESEEFDAPLGPNTGSSPVFSIPSAAPARKTVADDFLNSDNDKNDYDWLLTPPGTPLFPSLEMESHKKAADNLGTVKPRPTALKSRLSNQPEPTARSNIISRQPALSPGNNSSSGLRRPTSAGGSRSSTPTGRPTLSTSRSALALAAKPTTNISSKGTSTLTASKSSPTTLTASRSSRSATPTSRAVPPSTKSAVPPRSSTPNSRSTARPLTPTSRPSIPGSKSTSRVSTPTRRPVTSSAIQTGAPPPARSASSSVAKSSSTTVSRNPAPPRASSPTAKPRPWNPSEMPGFSLDAPPNLRTSLSDRPASATRGRPGAPISRSSSIEPSGNGRGRRQSCSPSRGRPPNGVIHNSGSSVPVPAMSRLHAKANDNMSPVMIGNKMVERVINMRKLAPPRQDNHKNSPNSNLSAKSSSPDSTGFGRTLSKKSLDMAMRHMDIRRAVPGNQRPSMTNIPASSMYSVRSRHSRSRTVSVTDSPLATSSNASSEVSVNNNALCIDEVSSDRGGVRSPASIRSSR